MGTTKTGLFTNDQNALAKALKALANPARLAILEHIIKADGCITTSLAGVTGLAQPTVSQHLRELKEAGIIKGTVEGVTVSYCIDPERWEALRRQVNGLFDRVVPRIEGGCA
jgi:DNA-binding transcriptional ArsR family regulator